MKFNSHKVGLSLIWLAGLTILLHAVIPHHHHYSPNQSCHSSEQHKTVLNAVHSHSCSAFNVLIDQENKKTTRKIFNNIDSPFNLSQIELSDFLKSTQSDFHFTFKDRLVTSLLLRSCQPVRGSPLS
jgi:hypothetical protein